MICRSYRVPGGSSLVCWCVILDVHCEMSLGTLYGGHFTIFFASVSSSSAGYSSYGYGNYGYGSYGYGSYGSYGYGTYSGAY